MTEIFPDPGYGSRNFILPAQFFEEMDLPFDSVRIQEPQGDISLAVFDNSLIQSAIGSRKPVYTSTKEADVKEMDLASSENVKPLIQAPSQELSNKIQSRKADLERLLEEDPNMQISLDDGSTISLRELNASVDEDMAALEAITTCRVA